MERHNKWNVIMNVTSQSHCVSLCVVTQLDIGITMGCINSKVAPMPRSDRVRSKKERKILREALKKECIVAKVSKCGVAYDILVNNDMQKPKLPPIGITFYQNQGLKKEHTNESISDCCPRETLLKRKFSP